MEKFKGVKFKGKELICHEDFSPYLKKLDLKLIELDLNIYITSSLRHNTNVKGAIVKPAKMSNHLVGHAIDFNLFDSKKWYNSSKLKNPTGKALAFIEYVREIGLRWGGDFKTRDVIHIDDALNLLDPKKYKEILNR